MKISINEPCHENWDKMTPNDKGAFCLSCQKNVIDFSCKTIKEIKSFFQKKSDSEIVCGRFDETQLVALTFDDFFNKFMKWKYFQKAALIVFFVFGMGLFAGAQSKPEISRPTMGAVAYVQHDTSKIVAKKDPTEKTVKRVKVKKDPKKEPKPSNSNKIMGEPMIENKKTK
jgi:hypothetical protein